MRGSPEAKCPKEADESESPSVKLRLPLELTHSLGYSVPKNGKENGSGVSREASSA
jgi:hypothetical protein